MIQLPLSIDRDAWNEYEAMRKRIKKPLTDMSAKRLINRLHELQAKGYDANEALLVAADCHWLTVYPPKDMSIEAKPGHAAQKQAQDWVAEQEAAKAALRPIPAEIRDKLALVRRRA